MSLADWFSRHVAPRTTALGITPRSVTLQVRGRRSGRPFSHSPRSAARHFFGLEDPTLEDMERLAPRFPVFEVRLGKEPPRSA